MSNCLYTSTRFFRRSISGRAIQWMAMLLFVASPLVSSGQITIDPDAPEPIDAIKGSLVIVGGGGTPDSVWKRFMELAGGEEAHIVVIPTASANADTLDKEEALAPWKSRNAASVQLLHTRSKDEANSESFVSPLKRATGVWFGGGQQSRITDAYLGTLVETELKGVMERGGVIGGTSAGAAIMTDVMIAGGNPQARIGQGFGFLPGAVVDQHFSERNRMNRLSGVLASNPGLVGFGIDERTALIVYEGRRLQVIGESEVAIVQAANEYKTLGVTRFKERAPRQARRGGRGQAAARQGQRQGRGQRAGQGGGRGQRQGRGRGQRQGQRAGGRGQRGQAGQPQTPRPAYQADLLALTREAQARTGQQFPAVEPPKPNVRKGTLMIVGGGGTPEGLWERMIEYAGGPDAKIVVVPTAGGHPEELARVPSEVRALTNAGAKNVVVLHTISRDRSNNDAEFLSIIEGAGGVWFGGGRQWHLVDSYQNTKVHQLMLDVLERGGVIAGSSAGASIQGDYMCRGNPLGSTDILAPGYERGLGFLVGVGIDQHFTQRGRQPNMTQLMKAYPQILGIGLDERTSIIVQGSVAEIFGANNVAFYDRTKPIPAEGPDYLSLKGGDYFDLAKREIVDKPEGR